MSRAFVKEDDVGPAEPLAELQISPHRNLVTAEGLAQIEENVDRLRSALAGARAAEDRAELLRIQRDLRYWTARQGSAELVPATTAGDRVRFGSTVRLALEGGATVTYRLVGEDEADPASGKLSYVSPIGRALVGKGIGDEVALRDGTAEILALE
jgi:transcription elongation GreA/GreB family factor